jgi:ABC-type polysaccharide/polyol phosphate transport system ATPase subunit
LPTLPEGTVRVDHVWKRFRADRAHPKLHDQLVGLGRRVRGERADWRWVLRDVNLHVEPGETVALVGVNGSGKSTLLKVISQVIFQTSGTCSVAGRIGALLEVRSGIHPELTGQENVYLYGAILGLSRRQISDRFDAIVDFAGVSDAIDRPVKYYSSGMQVRLGFSIAAFLEPAVLLVDEVLAVGDANFQQKCLMRISEVVQNGTTLLFVSHDLASVQAMCDRSLWLEDSIVRADGATGDVLALYRESVNERATQTLANDGDVSIVKVELEGEDGEQIRSGGPLHARFIVRMPEAGFSGFYIGVSEGTAMPIFVIRRAVQFEVGEVQIDCSMRDLPLPKGHYTLWIGIGANSAGSKLGPGLRKKPFLVWQSVASFDVFGPLPTRPPNGVMVLSPVHVEAEWEVS